MEDVRTLLPITPEHLDGVIIGVLLSSFRKDLSHLSPDAFIEERILYNSSFSKLRTDIVEDGPYALSIRGSFCDEDAHLQVLRTHYLQEEKVYDSFVYCDGTLPSHQVVVWKRGEWEKQVIALGEDKANP